VRARDRTRAAAGAATGEQAFEQVVQVDAAEPAPAAEPLGEPDTATGGAPWAAALASDPHPVVVVLGNLAEVRAEPVVPRPGRWIGQHVVGLVDLFEPVIGGRILVDVRVVAALQCPESSLDLVRAGIP